MRDAELLEAYLDRVVHAPAQPARDLDLVARPEPSLAARRDAEHRGAQERFDQVGLPRGLRIA